QLDERDDERVVERRDLRMMVDDEAVHDASTAGLNAVPIERPTRAAHRSRWVSQSPTRRAALDEELAPGGALEEERVVLRDRGTRTLRPLRLCFRSRPLRPGLDRLLPVRGGFELQDAEEHRAHQLTALVVVADAWGGELTQAE